MEYKTDVTDSHERNEELQWARIMASGNSAAGMAVVFIQKLCTAFHELGPAWEAAGLKENQLDFFKHRMAARIKKVLSVLELNGLGNISGCDEFHNLLKKTESAVSLEELASLTEPVHMINHKLCDALEGKI